MRLRFVWVTCALILTITINKAVAQYPATYHHLTANEFGGVPVYNSGDVVAMTACHIDFSCTAHAEKNYYLLTCNVHLLFDHEKSWIDRRKIAGSTMMDEVLKHEQGHYTISYLEQQEFLRTISRTVFTANYKKEVNDLFDKLDAKYAELNRNYDRDTDNMRNREQQRSWDDYFRKRLEYMPPEQLASN